MVSLAPVSGFDNAKMKYDFARMARGVSFGFKKQAQRGFSSLVKGSKSPTKNKIPEYAQMKPHFDYDCHELAEENYHEIEKQGFLDDSEDYNPIFDIDKSGKYLKIQHEEWSGTYSATALVQGKATDAPPVQEGDRITEKLSKAAATKIKKSAEYLSKHHRGYRAFITLTFTEKERDEIALHDKRGAFINSTFSPNPVIPLEMRQTIGKRVARFMNSMQQRYKEGMTINTEDENKKSHKFKIKGRGKSLNYIWVIENPKVKKVIHTKHGASFRENDNPHIHVLTDWTVKRRQFLGWAGRIEKLWGKGFANIRKIKKPASAAAYMAKAAGYIAKGADDCGQGVVRGNRYNISKSARAPLPKTLGLYALQDLAKLIKKGNDLGREKWPKGFYFHQYGFGVRGKNNWIEFARFLKSEGFAFMSATDFHMVTYEQKITDYLKRGFNDFYRAFKDIETAKAEFSEQINMNDFNLMHEKAG